jgi:hypothetical protein
MSYLNDIEINTLVQSALSNYEVSASWESAKQEVVEDCQEFYGKVPSQKQVNHCIQHARFQWSEITIKTKKLINKS